MSHHDGVCVCVRTRADLCRVCLPVLLSNVCFETEALTELACLCLPSPPLGLQVHATHLTFSMVVDIQAHLYALTQLTLHHQAFFPGSSVVVGGRFTSRGANTDDTQT